MELSGVGMQGQIEAREAIWDERTLEADELRSATAQAKEEAQMSLKKHKALKLELQRYRVENHEVPILNPHLE